MSWVRSLRVRRTAFALAAGAGAWALGIWLTGGFQLEMGGMELSSRDVRRPLLLALVSGSVALALYVAVHRRILVAGVRRAVSRSGRALQTTAAALARARWEVVASIAAAGAVALRVYEWTGARPLWLDEQMIALNIRERPLDQLAGALWLDQSAPLGWLITQRLALVWAGTGEMVLRLLPVLFGIGAVAVAWWAGRRWMTAAGATALVLLFAIGAWVSHYAMELKHYSADVFFGLLLPVLVAWVLEAGEPRGRLGRAGIWWTTAALGLWWAYGAMLVAPACALILTLAVWRTDGRRHATIVAAFGAIWFVSFGLHYLLALRFTVGSAYLQQYWRIGMPPSEAGVSGVLSWLVSQAEPFAMKPVGTELAVVLWLAVLAGLVWARPRVLAITLAAVPLSACLLAAAHRVPLYERLSLWVVPALYVGLAYCIDAGVRLARDAALRRQWWRLVPAAALCAAGIWLCVDIARMGWQEFAVGRTRHSNHQLDDRTGVRWLLAQARPGDVVVTTHLALPAVWWYGDVPLPETGGASLADGTPILEAAHHAPGPGCRDANLHRALSSFDRALVYFGFRFDDVPDRFDEVLLHSLDPSGDATAVREFAGVTRAAVVDLQAARLAGGAGTDDAFEAAGCVSVRPAVRW